MKKSIIYLILILFLKLQHADSKEAILLFGGIFGTSYNMNKIKKYFENICGYDVYRIDFLTRKSWDDCMKNITDGIEKIPLDSYDKINIFCHIFGGRILLEYFKDHKINNLSSIVFDKGPIQEELALAIIKQNGEGLILMSGGKSLVEFSYKPHSDVPLNLENVKIGMLIETKPIFICYFFKKTIKEGKPSFKPEDNLTKFDDYCYVPFNHRQMYNKYKIFGPEVIYFFQNGNFSGKANRNIKNYLDDF